jgi:predicted phage terminase large subunit-like protein
MKRGDLEVALFHEIIAAAFEDLFDRRYRKLIISCPPRSGKSMLGTFLLCWLLGKDHRSQHIVASYGSTLSGKFHREAVLYLKSKEFKRIFPSWEGFRAGSKYDMKQGGEILPTSVGGILTGFTAGTPDIHSPGIGIMLVDDPLKGSDSISAINELEPWWVEQASTRRTNNYAQVLIGTRFHERDLHGFLMESDGVYHPQDNPFGWRWINIEGLCEHPELDPLGRQKWESHWPSNPAFSVDMLLSQRASGERAFNALYQGHPSTQSGQIVKASWIITQPEEMMPELDYVWLGIDTAYEEKDSSDFTAVTIAGCSKREPGKLFIPKVVQGKWGFPELLAQIELIAQVYNVKAMAIEKAVSGISLIQVLKQKSKIPIQEMKPIRSKTLRLETVCPLLSEGKVIISEGEWGSDEFIHELTQFPYVAKKDRVDSFAWALLYFAIHLDRDRTIFGGNKPVTFDREKAVARFDREHKLLLEAPVKDTFAEPQRQSITRPRVGNRRRLGYDVNLL